MYAERPVAPDGGDPTRAALLETAEELFATRGYADVSTAEIVESAQVTRGDLYHHFEGKQDLFAAVHERTEEAFVASLLSQVAQIEDPWQALSEGVHAFLDATADPRVLKVLYIDAPAVLGVPRWREVTGYHGVQALTASLRRAIRAGRIVPADPESLANLVHGSLIEAAMMIATASDPQAVRRQVEVPLAEFLEGLRAPASAPT